MNRIEKLIRNSQSKTITRYTKDELMEIQKKAIYDDEEIVKALKSLAKM